MKGIQHQPLGVLELSTGTKLDLKGLESGSTRSPDIEELVQIDKIEMLYKQSISAAIISLISSGLLARLLWLHDNSRIVLIWYITMVIATCFRLSVFYAFSNSKDTGRAVLAWAFPYFITLSVSSAVWGIGALIILPKDSLLHQAIVLYFLMGMCAGAMAVYTTYQSYALSTIYLILGPITVWSLFQDSYISVYMGAGATLFLVAAARITKVIATSQHDNFLRKYQLTEAEQKAERLAKSDPLTGLSNRKSFEQEAQELIEHGMQSFSLAVIGIDRMQHINDQYGLDAGDEVLKQVAKTIESTILEGDICARLGGDEFVIMLPDAGQDMGILVAEKLNDEIPSVQYIHGDDQFSISVSIGVAANKESLKTALVEADKAMDEAKQSGRNQYIVFNPAL